MLMPKEPPVPSQAVHLLGTPADTIYIYGEVRYIDVFNIERVTSYRLMYGDPNSVRDVRMKSDMEGNDAT